MIALLGALTLAAAPEGLRPVMARPTAAAAYQAWLAKSGKPAAELACEAAWPGLAALCFRVWEPVAGGAAGRRARRWVTVADLTVWEVDRARLRAALAVESAARLRAAPERPVEGLPGRYLEIIDGDGWSAAAVLAPEVLAERLGGAPIAVALPSDSVMLAWKPGNEQVDLAMAVGVHELFVAAETPVTEVVHRWDGVTWTAWAVTTPAPTP